MRHDDLTMDGEASVVIAAPAEELYDMVSDVTRMGEWSPHTRAARWLEGATRAVVGVRFEGDNLDGNDRWTLPATVVVADRGSEFAFVTGKPEGPATRWTYTFEAVHGGTLVTESFSWTWAPSETGFRARVGAASLDEAQRLIVERRRYLLRSIRTTLDNLKAAAER